MPPLQFPRNLLPLSLEDFLHEIRKTPGQTLSMPIHLQLGGGFGGAVHAIQVIAALAQQNSDALTLKVPSAFAKNKITQERFASTLPGMAALYFAKSISCNGEPFDRRKALEAVAPRVMAMQNGTFRDTLRGVGAALCCFAGARNEFLAPLYAQPEPGHVRDLPDFRVLLPRMLQQLGVRVSDVLNEGQLDYLSSFVHQLFLNADEHGSYDPFGERYEHAMRGIAVRLNNIQDLPSLIKYAGDDSSLKSYLLKRVLLSKDKNSTATSESEHPAGPAQILEISVFDTGPGLALHWLAEKIGRHNYSEISLTEELEAVQTCFKKHATTKSSRFFGEGLSMALTAMKQLNAFMTLRTGRLSLYQDFSKSDTIEFQPSSRFQKSKKLDAIAGASYTVCFRVK